MELEKQLKIARKILDLTQKNLAHELGLSHSTIAKWEQRKSNIQKHLRPLVENWIEKSKQQLLQPTPWYKEVTDGIGIGNQERK
jgi:transcriptional regulator with XRE-family HTH domain